MDIEAVLDRLMEAGVSVWLDEEGKLRIDKGAPEEIKQLVREHKQELIDVRRAQDFMNRAGIRIIRLPLGQHALAYPLRTNLDELRWAARVLRMDSMPLVINDEGLEWISPEEWRRRQVARICEEYRRERLKKAAEAVDYAPVQRWRA
ncbi:MAG TPA: hypothetical protein PLA43_10670 [Bryobacteraceae bacterium]|nr:hypothetical protein [Bryobacteraceae bacterium]HPU72410.1 hypothetical protein [Bryobacteraceae bacterium]